MTDIELLPLPGAVVVDMHIPTGVRIYAYDAATLGDYARTNVEHHTAKLRVEIDALQDLCAAAYQMAGVHDAPVEWLDALSNAANGKPFSTDGLLPYMPKSVCDAEVLAERLEEAFAGAAAQPEAVDEEMVEREDATVADPPLPEDRRTTGKIEVGDRVVLVRPDDGDVILNNLKGGEEGIVVNVNGLAVRVVMGDRRLFYFSPDQLRIGKLI